jgi:23S rRNA pseudouridine2457 synthase
MLIAFHKPFDVLSQFTQEHPSHRTLAEFGFPPHAYAIGRLDRDSEGLILLSDEAHWNDRLLNPRHRLDTEPAHPPRDPPIRFRKNIPTSWLELTLTEGKNRQVRRMTAAVGFPTLRLVRVSIGGLRLADLGIKEGQWRQLTAEEQRKVIQPSR